MSQIFISGFVILLAQILPAIGVSFPEETLTVVAQFVVTVGAALWVMVRRHNQGDINAAGVKKGV